MLVLSRKPNETIVAGEVTITVVAINGRRVRLGIEAPRHVNISRGEKRAGPDDSRQRTDLEFQPAA